MANPILMLPNIMAQSHQRNLSFSDRPFKKNNNNSNADYFPLNVAPFQILNFVYFATFLFYTLQTRKLDRLNFRKDFWDCYWRWRKTLVNS